MTDVDEAPALTGKSALNYRENLITVVATYAAADPENGAITWSQSGDDADDLTISEGALSFASSPDYESPADSDSDNDYEVTVSASDGTHTVSLDVTVTVTNTNEVPVIKGDASPSFAENATGTVTTYTATDPEGGPIEWEILYYTWSSRGDVDSFAIDSESGELSMVKAADYETKSSYSIQVWASDEDGVSKYMNVTVTIIGRGRGACDHRRFRGGLRRER